MNDHKDTKDTKKMANLLSNQVLGAAIEVHRILGPGLLESSYEACLCYELSDRGIRFRRQVALPVIYKGVKLDCGYRIDLLLENLIIVEVKSIEAVAPIHIAQLLTYLRLQDIWLGLLINFNVPRLREGIKRLVN